MSKILVTGGTGLVGRALWETLGAVYVSSEDADLRNPLETRWLVKDIGPDVIIHLAGKVGGVLDNIKYPVDFMVDNLKINTNICEAAIKCKVKHFVGCLSTCVYPDKATYPMLEKDIFSGKPSVSNLGYSYGKRILLELMECYNLQNSPTRFSGLIPCNMFGSNDKSSHFIPSLINKIKQATDKIELHGTGKEMRQFMFVDDFAEIIKSFVFNIDMLSSVNYPFFNVAPEEEWRIKDIVGYVQKAMGTNLTVEFNDIDNTQYRKSVDSSKLNAIMPLKFTNIQDALRVTCSN